MQRNTALTQISKSWHWHKINIAGDIQIMVDNTNKLVHNNKMLISKILEIFSLKYVNFIMVHNMSNFCIGGSNVYNYMLEASQCFSALSK